MNDMRAVIVPKSDQINADDLLGGPITITIREVTIRPGTEQPVSVHFDGDGNKPYKPCKSMARVMVTCWGPDANEYTGRSMTLYCDPKIMWGGMAVGGIRISHMSHIKSARTMPLTATKGSKKPFTVQPLAEAEPKRTAATWMAELRVRLAAAQDEAAVETIAKSEDVQKALGWLKDGALAELNAMLSDAVERVKIRSDGAAENVPVEDDDIFPGDRAAS